MRSENDAEALKYSRKIREDIETASLESFSNPARRAWAISAKKNLEDARGVNDEMLELFKHTGAQYFTELPDLKVDYRAGLGILQKWMKRVDNADVVSTIADLVIPYVNVLDEPENSELIASLVHAFCRVAKYDRNPQFLALLMRSFASRLDRSQADILFALCENEFTSNALRIYLVEGLTKLKDDRAKRFLPDLLRDDEFWVVNVAIESCRRMKALACLPQLQALSESFPDPKTRKKASSCVASLSKIETK